eukprot:CAMPEP_0116855188 /NCGR_PEP_ID=MMETSP0418-20121206/19101_1 /TAXON_ID=1158023 /ORGANISM="Astrosyne radiata, Strain 13vi08-1A" /LENGTH=117 /DNA_ID=CAMNT_0004488217 /DNA_START=41 /DNA_END=391 /DNA_ORIENTATION=-
MSGDAPRKGDQTAMAREDMSSPSVDPKEDDATLPENGGAEVAEDFHEEEEAEAAAIDDADVPAGSSGSGADQPKKKRTKYKKAPQAPRRFKSAYMFFSTTKHREIREQLGERGISEK